MEDTLFARARTCTCSSLGSAGIVSAVTWSNILQSEIRTLTWIYKRSSWEYFGKALFAFKKTCTYIYTIVFEIV